MSSLRLMVLGVLGSSPFAGVAWQVLHYLEGLRRLGHDVYYVEDTGAWPYDPLRRAVTDDCSYTVSYLARVLEPHGMGGRWAYRAATDDRSVYGLSEGRLAELYTEADAILNLTGSTVLRDEHLGVPVRVYVETDPVLPQLEIASGRQRTIDLLAAHTHHVTFGENIGSPDCPVPVVGFHYMPTRQPVVLDWWRAPEAQTSGAVRLTTVGNWIQSGKDVEWNGETYRWSKHHEFLKLLDLPQRAAASFELALSSVSPEDESLLQAHGWQVVDAVALSSAPDPYRSYILGSSGEFTVAKDQNVRLQSGWFSDRSACYLAAGKPVVTQDTGFSRVLPVGEGLFSFATIDDAVSACEAIAADPPRHGRAAREIAEEYFRAETVLSRLLASAGL